MLYLNELAQQNLIHQPQKEKYLIQERRIDHIQYNTQFFTTADLIDSSDDHVV